MPPVDHLAWVHALYMPLLRDARYGKIKVQNPTNPSLKPFSGRLPPHRCTQAYAVGDCQFHWCPQYLRTGLTNTSFFIIAKVLCSPEP
jgi:hypothetical protein